MHVTKENFMILQQNHPYVPHTFFTSKKKSDQYYVDLAFKCATTSQNSAYHRRYRDKDIFF